MLPHKWVGLLSREKQPSQQLHSKKGWWANFWARGWAYFRAIGMYFLCYQLVSLHMLISLKRCLVHPYSKMSSYATVWYEQSVTRVHMCIAKIGYSIISKSLVHCLMRESSSYTVPILLLDWDMKAKYKLYLIIGTIHTHVHIHTHTHMHTPEYSLPCWCLPLDSLTYMY